MSEQPSELHCRRYWQKNITLVMILLGVWFVVSLGAGILFRDWLDEVSAEGGECASWLLDGSARFYHLFRDYFIRLQTHDEQAGG